MLGPDRFASFETPNVIDPGDEAPLQPKRKGPPPKPATTTPSAASPSSTNTSGPPRSNKSLGRTRKISLNNQNNSYRQERKSPQRVLNDIDDLDLEYGHLPDTTPDIGTSTNTTTIDEARHYAASLLQDADRRTNTTRMVEAEEPSNSSATATFSPRHAKWQPLENDNDGNHNHASKHLVRRQVVRVTLQGCALASLIAVLIFLVTRL